ncbi:MAG: glycosyltransferase [Candidatus Lutacidiplasmatales archaeon]
MKVFGSKSGGWIGGSRLEADRPNIELLGAVSHEELRGLYTNALFTAFPFTEEPFGFVPIESMACGTPVLTYAKQGPGETVVDGLTGWLVPSSPAFLRQARRVHELGYPTSWRDACIRHANIFRLEVAGARWNKILRSTLDRGDLRPPTSRSPGGPILSATGYPALERAH